MYLSFSMLHRRRLGLLVDPLLEATWGPSTLAAKVTSGTTASHPDGSHSWSTAHISFVASLNSTPTRRQPLS